MANFILGIAMIAMSIVSIFDAKRMTEMLHKRHSLEPIGPDLYLAGIGTLLGLLGSILVFLSFREIRLRLVSGKFLNLAQTHILVIGALFLYALMLPILGYPLSTLGFFFFAFPLMGFSDLRWMIPSSIAATAALYIIFVVLADMPLPTDPWGLLARSSR